MAASAAAAAAAKVIHFSEYSERILKFRGVMRSTSGADVNGNRLAHFAALNPDGFVPWKIQGGILMWLRETELSVVYN